MTLDLDPADQPGDVDLVELDDEDVLGARLSLLGGAADEPQHLGVFTDEELLALDGMPEAPPVPSPWYSSLSDAERAIALTAALRGLTARGVYLAEPVDEAAHHFISRAAPEILALMTMRRHVPSVVVAERKTAEQTDWVVLHEQRGAIWLAEYIDRRGMHEFVLATSESSASSLTTWSGAVPGRAVPDLDVVVSRAQLAQRPTELDPVAACTVAVTVTRFDLSDPGVDTWSGVYTGPDGAYVSTAVTETDAIAYLGSSADDVEQHWRRALGLA